MIHATVVNAAHLFGVTKLLYLGSSCIAPREAPQPMAEDALLTGPLEPTNESYAIAKIAGIKLCQAYRRQYGCNFISAMPTNLYGPNDNFDLQGSHVLPAMIRKLDDAKVAGAGEVTFWGTGTARREFLHGDDLADSCLSLLHLSEREAHLNGGTGQHQTMREVPHSVATVAYPRPRVGPGREAGCETPGRCGQVRNDWNCGDAGAGA